MNYREELVVLAEAYCQKMELSEARVANLAGCNGEFFARMRAGRAAQVDTLERVKAWFSENWPDGLAWPKNVARPGRGRSRAA